MDKRYQIFVSSTFVDLQDERSKVMQTLMEMDCIPAGMELFPAADEEQLNFIKRVIDDCDYYLLIIGGRYGSQNDAGVSYTEMEYDYALERGLKVIALLHGSTDSLPVAKSERSPEGQEKLRLFREKVSKGRLVKFWEDAAVLPGLVALSVGKAIKAYPAVGWVRANTVTNVQALSELNELRKQNAMLEKDLQQLRKTNAPRIQDLASLDEACTLHADLRTRAGLERNVPRRTTWRVLFAGLAPLIMTDLSEGFVKDQITRLVFGDYSSYDLVDLDFQTIKVQFLAHGLIEFPRGSWRLSKRGVEVMLEVAAVRAGKSGRE